MLVLVLILIGALLEGQGAIQTVRSNWNRVPIPPPSWVGVEPGTAKRGEKTYDVDTHLIHTGLQKAPTLPDTLRWWTGTWVGQVPFYRPLTSYVFWSLWKLNGDREDRYNLASILTHLAAIVGLMALAERFFCVFSVPFPVLGALVTGYIFVTGGNILVAQSAIAAETYGLWKNVPDSLTLLWFSLALLCYLRDRESNRLTGWPLLFFVLLCLTKEAGVFLPLLLPILEIDRGRIPRRGWHRLLPFGIVLPLYLLLRTLFLRDAVGFRYGSNGAWGYRLLHNLFGPISESLVPHHWLPPALALIATVGLHLWWGRQDRPLTPRERRGAGIVLVLLPVVGWLILCLQAGPVSPFQAFWLIQENEMMDEIIACTLFLSAVTVAFRERPQFASVLYTWAVLALGLTLFSPSVLHRYYLVNAAFALLLAVGIVCIAHALIRRTAPRWLQKMRPLMPQW